MSNLSSTGHDLTPLAPEDRATREATLSPEERRVLLNHGTEPAFCGGLLREKGAGVYCCRLCGLPLFSGDAKFDSGTGWPSFAREFDPAHVKRLEDRSYGMRRVEIRCGRCDSHLGHVFDDGPRPTGERHCLNSVALTFRPAAGA